MPRKFSISKLHRKAESRKAGYIEAVLAVAIRSGDELELDEKQFNLIRQKYALPSSVRTDWPVILLPMKRLAVPGDKGLGDIVERVIGPVGGTAYKVWYLAIFGRPCGCTIRKDRLNKRYPLQESIC